MEAVVWSGACVLVGLREVGVQDPVCGGARGCSSLVATCF